MKVYNIFFSPTGSTKRAANELVSAWNGDIAEIDLIKEKNKLQRIEFSKDDVVFISVPSFGGRIPSVIPEMFEGITGNKSRAVLTAVYGNRAYEDTLVSHLWGIDLQKQIQVI